VEVVWEWARKDTLHNRPSCFSFAFTKLVKILMKFGIGGVH